MAKKLTLKQRKWLACYMDEGNATECALRYYDLDRNNEKDRHSAEQIGYENMRKLEIEIVELMDEAGITDVYLMKKLKENLNATKLFGKNAIKHDDFASRNKALETALKVKGKLVDKFDHTSKGKRVSFGVVSYKDIMEKRKNNEQ